MGGSHRNLEVNAHEAIRVENAMEERRAGERAGERARTAAEMEERRAGERARRAAVEERRWTGEEGGAGAAQRYSRAEFNTDMRAVDRVGASRQAAAAKQARAEVRTRARAYKHTVASAQTTQKLTSVVAEEAGQQLRACFAQRPPL